MDLETIRQRAEFLALEALVIMIVRALRESSPSVAQSLPVALRQTGEILTRVHPMLATAEQGDLLMAELQEAWERLSQRVLPPKA